MNTPTRLSRLLRIHGRVQGVGYRASALRQGEQLGLDGWVRNRADGSVEAEIHGPAAAVEAFIAWSRQGPAAATVSTVQVEAADDSGLSGFHVRPTA